MVWEKIQMEKQGKERKENVYVIVDNFYEDWIKIFLNEKDDGYKNYIKNLLLESSIRRTVRKDSFLKFYDEFSLEEKKNLKKF